MSELVRLLHVEDDEDDHFIVSEMLDQITLLHFEVDWVASYDAGIEHIGKNAYDLCLLDFNIGPHTGVEFIKAGKGDVDVPIILLAGIDDIEVDIAASEAGAIDFLSKHELTPRGLDRSIRYALRTSRNIRALKSAQLALSTSKAELEIKVQERTEELLQINKSLQKEIAERQKAEDRLRHDALHDRITDLPNRNHFLDRTKQALARSRHAPSTSFAVLLLNLDRFKAVNDGLGHEAGDALLAEVGYRLRQHLRVSDTLARMGGNDFAVLVEDSPMPGRALACAERLQEAFNEPFVIDAQEVYCQISAGVTLSSFRYVSAESMILDAQIALTTAKKRGKNRIEMFERSLRSVANGQLKTESELRRACREPGQIQMYYQPILDLGSRRVAGFEALMRWHHPMRGLVSPGEFVPLAEETGLIVPLGEIALKDSVRQIRAWQQEHPGNGDLFVSVNVSRRQIMETDLRQLVVRTLEETGLAAECLKLEITESLIMQNKERFLDLLRDLKSLNVGLSVDDFGTGYSCLCLLSGLPFDTMKIDRAFVMSVVECAADREILKTVVELAETLEMDTVGEGVENEEQMEVLKSIGCRTAQGYLFAPPMPAERAVDWLKGRGQDAVADARQGTPAFVAA